LCEGIEKDQRKIRWLGIQMGGVDNPKKNPKKFEKIRKRSEKSIQSNC
jgi:hypothetical protein